MEDCRNFIAEVLGGVPEIGRIHSAHISQNHELLPHVFMGDIARFVGSHAHRAESQSALIRLLGQFDKGLQTGSEEVKELIVVSFLEHLADEPDTLKALKPLMGPVLRREAAEIYGWD